VAGAWEPGAAADAWESGAAAEPEDADAWEPEAAAESDDEEELADEGELGESVGWRELEEPVG
jgi:hypothetical protein